MPTFLSCEEDREELEVKYVYIGGKVLPGEGHVSLKRRRTRKDIIQDGPDTPNKKAASSNS